MTNTFASAAISRPNTDRMLHVHNTVATTNYFPTLAKPASHPKFKR